MANDRLAEPSRSELRDRVAELELQLEQAREELSRHHATHRLPRGEPVVPGERTVRALTIVRGDGGLSRLAYVDVPASLYRTHAHMATDLDLHAITLQKAEHELLALVMGDTQ